ncbi:MAG: M66 family metalloprotease [Gemmatimonadota bacterium]|nr:M66 family metalloprotease [Gemmatimonadota bacterium]
MAEKPESDSLLRHTRTLLPVEKISATDHEPVLSTTNSAFQLLYQTRAIRVLERGTGHYMGMMSGEVTGAAGVAFVPGRSSFSIPSGSVIAHELGHNMHLWHAPCGGAGGPDPMFPYPDGSTGAWGYDLDGDSLVSPETPDLMSYCGPKWISDYHFTNALGWRLHDEGPSEA